MDVLHTVPGPKRSVMRVCRAGRIKGAVRVGRRWLAPRAAIDAWLQTLTPRATSKDEHEGDDLEEIRERLARPSRSRWRA